MTITLDLGPAIQLSEEQFFDFCQRNPHLRIERTAQGELVIMPPVGGESGYRNLDLSGQLYVWAKADGTGVGFDSSTGFILPSGAERSPDASWVRRERWEALTPLQRRRFPPLCPDFVVELMSPSDTRASQQAKLREYLDNGARLGWLIDPEAGEVEVYRPGQEPEVLVRPDSLSGEDVLPGFVLDLGTLL